MNARCMRPPEEPHSKAFSLCDGVASEKGQTISPGRCDPMSEMRLGRVKTPTFNLRVEIPSFPRLADILGVRRHVSKVPVPDLSASSAKQSTDVAWSESRQPG